MALRDWFWEPGGWPSRVLCWPAGGNTDEQLAVAVDVLATVLGKSCGPGAGGFPEVFETREAQSLLLAFSLLVSRQAHWHWHTSSCLMMITGTLRPICCTGFPGERERKLSLHGEAPAASLRMAYEARVREKPLLGGPFPCPSLLLASNIASL